MERYEILKEIGKGSFGNVFKVKNKETGEIFALKKIYFKEHKPEDSQYIINEMKILSYNNCKYLLKCYDIFLSGRHICIVTDLCEKADLRQLITRRKRRMHRISEELIWKILIQLCIGIKYLHKYNVIHRDLKTANIFLDNHYNIYIGDFGVSKILKPHNNFTKTIIGTPYYCSPELVKGIKYDKKVDIWALGCILCEMMIMDYAFMSNNIHSLNFKIVNGNYVLPNEDRFSKELVNLVKAMINTNIDKRPTIDDILNNPEIFRRMHNNKYKFQKIERLNDIIVNKGLNKYFSNPSKINDWNDIIRYINMDIKTKLDSNINSISENSDSYKTPDTNRSDDSKCENNSGRKKNFFDLNKFEKYCNKYNINYNKPNNYNNYAINNNNYAVNKIMLLIICITKEMVDL